jgi:hypothetical protein
MLHYRFLIALFILIMALYMGVLGYNEKDTNYKKEYIKTTGKITNKTIESIDTIERKKNRYRHVKKFRIKLFYTYKVKDKEEKIKEYKGEFYNDGNNDEFLEDKRYIPIGKMYNSTVFMNVFYNKDKPHDSCINFNEIKNRKKKIYYIISIILFFTLPFILFFENDFDDLENKI